VAIADEGGGGVVQVKEWIWRENSEIHSPLRDLSWGSEKRNQWGITIRSGFQRKRGGNTTAFSKSSVEECNFIKDEFWGVAERARGKLERVEGKIG